MRISHQELERHARMLPAKERAGLAERLLKSLCDVGLGSVEAAWQQEVAARIAASIVVILPCMPPRMSLPRRDCACDETCEVHRTHAPGVSTAS